MVAEAAYVQDVLWCLDAEGADAAPSVASAQLRGLLERIRTGDQAAFEMLVAELAPPLERYARRFSRSNDAAQDLIQDIFAHLWEHRTTIQIRGSVRAYLYTAVRNHALNVRRRDVAESARWSAGSTERHAVGMGKGDEPADVAVVRKEIAVRVAAALDTLPPRAREAALLRWNDGLNRQEIADIMGVALGTVKNHLALATETLRALLADLRDTP